jgi:hypothetical protein
MNKSRFTFDATTLVDGFFPMPPGLTRCAAELFNRFLLHLVNASPRLNVLDHKIRIAPTQALEDASREILRAKFPMPCEGWDEPITTFDRIAFEPEEIHFTLNPTFTAYLLTAASCGDVLRKAMTTATAPQPLPLDEADRDLVVASLQREHYFKTVQRNDHVIHALKNGTQILPPETFSLDRLTAILRKLRASTAP